MRSFRFHKAKSQAESRGSDAWEKSLRSRRLGGGDSENGESDRTKIGLTLISLKSFAFVNLHVVINGLNEFAKDHQAQTN
jgi:hypothetical protein